MSAGEASVAAQFRRPRGLQDMTLLRAAQAVLEWQERERSVPIRLETLSERFWRQANKVIHGRLVLKQAIRR
jgi:hypothetical protein